MSEPTPAPASSVLLVGGPDAGKSNYLFRLWMAVDDCKGTLVKNGLPDEVEYLRTGAESLLGGAFAGRTSKEVIEHVSIPVRSARDPAVIGVLNVPDVPGEKVLEVYRLRRWTDTWEQRITTGCGCLVFIRAGSTEIVSPLDYTQCVAAFGAPLPAVAPAASEVAAGPEAEPARGTENGQTTPTYEPPTDVVLTDWLQFLRRAFTQRVGVAYRPRIGVVVAAWDAVPQDSQGQPPRDFLADNFPLTSQFIEANSASFDFQIFGLSILSGDLKNDADFRAKFQEGTPSDFGYVIHSLSGKPSRDSDVTLPVAWALGWTSPAKDKA